MPTIGEPEYVEVNTEHTGYHTHTSGDLVFSNPFHNAQYDPKGGDAEWVNISGQPLYLGVVGPDGPVSVGICEVGKCPTTGRGGTKPTRIVP